MMARRASLKDLRRDAPEWVFPWQPLGRPALIRWFPVFWVAVVFAVILTSVRIMVTPPKGWKTDTASLIHVTDDAQGEFLRLKAREGGPFPSRFEPSESLAIAKIEKSAMESAAWSQPNYVPKLRGLSDRSIPTSVKLAAQGVAMMPKRSSETMTRPAFSPSKLSPVMHVLTAGSSASLSGEPPPFEGDVDAVMAIESWRFLVQLDAVGKVGECISLSGGELAGQSRLIAWLQKTSFKPDPKKPTRWIAVDVAFTNQAANEPINR